jgi:hypothetical protein
VAVRLVAWLGLVQVAMHVPPCGVAGQDQVPPGPGLAVGFPLQPVVQHSTKSHMLDTHEDDHGAFWTLLQPTLQCVLVPWPAKWCRPCCLQNMWMWVTACWGHQGQTMQGIGHG